MQWLILWRKLLFDIDDIGRMITAATLLQNLLVAERESDVIINAEGANYFLNFSLMAEQDECAAVFTAVFPPAVVRVLVLYPFVL